MELIKPNVPAWPSLLYMRAVSLGSGDIGRTLPGTDPASMRDSKALDGTILFVDHLLPD